MINRFQIRKYIQSKLALFSNAAELLAFRKRVHEQFLRAVVSSPKNYTSKGPIPIDL